MVKRGEEECMIHIREVTDFVVIIETLVITAWVSRFSCSVMASLGSWREEVKRL